MNKPKIANLVNPSKKHIHFAEKLIPFLKENTAQEWVTISKSHPNHTETVVRWAIQENIETLIVWGGDGTVNRVINELAKQNALEKISLGIVPVGTCNDFARWANIPLGDFKQSWDIAQKSDSKDISLWQVKDSLFFNNAGFGRSIESFKNHESSWKVLNSFIPHQMKIETPDTNLTGDYLMGLFCNAPRFSGGLHFNDSAIPTDTILNSHLIPPISKIQLLPFLVLGKAGVPLCHPSIKHIESSEITLTFSQDMPFQLDGEPPIIMPANTPCPISLYSKKVRIRFP